MSTATCPTLSHSQSDAPFHSRQKDSLASFLKRWLEIHTLKVVFAIVVLTSPAGSVHAYLGGFEAVDGYRDISNPFPLVAADYASNVFDVALYNAGQFGGTKGVDNGSAFPTPTPGTLWQRRSGTLQPNSGASGSFSYATAHRNADRSYVNSFPLGQAVQTGDPRRGLVITTNSDGWTANPSEYWYEIDQYDFLGSAASGLSTPTAIPGNTKVHISFWACTQIPGPGIGGLSSSAVGNVISLVDSSGSLGFELGYQYAGTGGDQIWYRAGNSSPAGITTPVQVTPHRYHRFDIRLDMLSNTIEVDVFDPFIGAGSTFNIAPAGTPTQTKLSDLSQLRFTSTPGINNQKYWSVDDFSFELVPEPASWLQALPALLAIGGYRRRNSHFSASA